MTTRQKNSAARKSRLGILRLLHGLTGTVELMSEALPVTILNTKIAYGREDALVRYPSGREAWVNLNRIKLSQPNSVKPQ